MVFIFRMASILLKVRASCPSRSAAGLLLNALHSPSMSGRCGLAAVSGSCLTHDLNVREPQPALPARSCKTARHGGARLLPQSSTTNVVLLEQRLVARLVVLLQVIEQRSARRHQLQEAAAGMVVLAVGLEMAGEVADAFRQDRDLHLRRTGVAGLERARLDDFRFTFCGHRHRQSLSLRPELLSVRSG